MRTRERMPPELRRALTDVFGDRPFVNVPHQRGVRWLTEIFSRSAEKYPHRTALQIPHTGESLTFAELDARAEAVAAALYPFLNGPDQVVAVAMSQDNWQIVACHLGILRAGGTVMVLDTTLPDALIAHMLNDAKPVVILTRGQDKFRDLPTLDVLTLPEKTPRRNAPAWLDDPTHRLATIFYTSGTTGMPKGVECPHAGYVNLALSYADYFDLLPGIVPVRIAEGRLLGDPVARRRLPVPSSPLPARPNPTRGNQHSTVPAQCQPSQAASAIQH